jgi:hypothetical protein
MLTTGPFSPVLNTPLSCPSPYSGTPGAAKVQVQNNSGFTLALQSPPGGQVFSVAPFTAATIPLAPTQGVVLDAIAGIGGTNEITLAWLLDHDTAPMQDGAIPTAEIAVIVLPLPPPALFNASFNQVQSGSAQQLNNLPAKTGIAMLADPANTNRIYVSGPAVSAASGYLAAGQGLVLPIANADALWTLGTNPDVLSYWVV